MLAGTPAHILLNGLPALSKACYRAPFTRWTADSMSSRLLTTWSGYDAAVGDILALAANTLQIFDRDLAPLKLESADRIAALCRLLMTARPSSPRVTIIVRQAEFVRQFSPLLMNLLVAHSPALRILQSPPHLETLRDSLLIADDQHVLVRFHDRQARARLIVDDIGESAPYAQHFAEILAEGGEPISASTLGL